jgi:hypothetical protein
MSTVERRSVAVMADRAREPFARRTIFTMVFTSLVLSAAVSWITAGIAGERTHALGRQVHQVVAKLSDPRTHITGRAGVRTAVATWEFPAGVPHSDVVTTSIADRFTSQTLWVDGTGARTSPPNGAATVVAAGLLTLTLSGLAMGAAAAATSVWRRRRLRVVVDAHWRSLVHHWWEDL